MSRVEVHGQLPVVGAKAKAIALDEAERSMRLITRATEGLIESVAPYEVKSAVQRTASRIEGTVSPSDWWWRFPEFGTGIYNRKRGRPIVPKRKQALRLASGDVVASVKGVRPKRYLSRARRLARPRTNNLLEHAADRIAKRLAGGSR